VALGETGAFLEMSEAASLRGIIPPLITPMRDGAVDTTALGRLIDHVVEGGVHGIFIAGTTGEYSMLSDSQWSDLLAGTVASTSGRVPVLVGVTRESTAETIAAAEQAGQVGADIVVTNTPAYFSVSQSELVSHFSQIADASPLPIMLYNIPQNTVNPIEHDTIVELAHHPNIMGLKDSSGALENLRYLRHRLAGSELRMYLGTDVLGDACVQLGLDGTVPSIANVVPRLVVDAWDAAEAGEFQRSARLHSAIAMYSRIYALGRSGSGGQFIAAIKRALALRGMPCGDPSPPVHAATDEETELIDNVLATADALRAAAV
jgi:4-hydroxy-tetrahydrodipicolinate synthase